MAQKREWSEEEISDIINRFKNQQTTREIGAIHNCSKTTVTRILKKNNVEIIDN